MFARGAGAAGVAVGSGSGVDKELLQGRAESEAVLAWDLGLGDRVLDLGAHDGEISRGAQD